MADDETTANENVAIAMALVICAGCATGLGAAAVFVPSIVKLASRRVLAGSLGFSAGVMTYVSFIEIFQKANGAFLVAEHTEGNAYLYATLCFFAGVVLMMVSSFFCSLSTQFLSLSLVTGLSFLGPCFLSLLIAHWTLSSPSFPSFYFHFRC